MKKPIFKTGLVALLLILGLILIPIGVSAQGPCQTSQCGTVEVCGNQCQDADCQMTRCSTCPAGTICPIANCGSTAQSMRGCRQSGSCSTVAGDYTQTQSCGSGSCTANTCTTGQDSSGCQRSGCASR